MKVIQHHRYHSRGRFAVFLMPLPDVQFVAKQLKMRILRGEALVFDIRGLEDEVMPYNDDLK